MEHISKANVHAGGSERVVILLVEDEVLLTS